ncbi:hypothetical protein HDU98_006838 [Podochytrium sp. JEL0797]|nr:hypothetical protein HDU98_006838 [Podochytrium sp. JEL0797]
MERYFVVKQIEHERSNKWYIGVIVAIGILCLVDTAVFITSPSSNSMTPDLWLQSIIWHACLVFLFISTITSVIVLYTRTFLDIRQKLRANLEQGRALFIAQAKVLKYCIAMGSSLAICYFPTGVWLVYERHIYGDPWLEMDTAKVVEGLTQLCVALDVVLTPAMAMQMNNPIVLAPMDPRDSAVFRVTYYATLPIYVLGGLTNLAVLATILKNKNLLVFRLDKIIFSLLFICLVWSISAATRYILYLFSNFDYSSTLNRVLALETSVVVACIFGCNLLLAMERYFVVKQIGEQSNKWYIGVITAIGTLCIVDTVVFITSPSRNSMTPDLWLQSIIWHACLVFLFISTITSIVVLYTRTFLDIRQKLRANLEQGRALFLAQAKVLKYCIAMGSSLAICYLPTGIWLIYEKHMYGDPWLETNTAKVVETVTQFCSAAEVIVKRIERNPNSRQETQKLVEPTGGIQRVERRVTNIRGAAAVTALANPSAIEESEEPNDPTRRSSEVSGPTSILRKPNMAAPVVEGTSSTRITFKDPITEPSPLPPAKPKKIAPPPKKPKVAKLTLTEEPKMEKESESDPAQSATATQVEATASKIPRMSITSTSEFSNIPSPLSKELEPSKAGSEKPPAIQSEPPSKTVGEKAGKIHADPPSKSGSQISLTKVSISKAGSSSSLVTVPKKKLVAIAKPDSKKKPTELEAQENEPPAGLNSETSKPAKLNSATASSVKGKSDLAKKSDSVKAGVNVEKETTAMKKEEPAVPDGGKKPAKSVAPQSVEKSAGKDSGKMVAEVKEKKGKAEPVVAKEPASKAASKDTGKDQPAKKTDPVASKSRSLSVPPPAKLAPEPKEAKLQKSSATKPADSPPTTKAKAASLSTKPLGTQTKASSKENLKPSAEPVEVNSKRQKSLSEPPVLKAGKLAKLDPGSGKLASIDADRSSNQNLAPSSLSSTNLSKQRLSKTNLASSSISLAADSKADKSLDVKKSTEKMSKESTTALESKPPEKSKSRSQLDLAAAAKTPKSRSTSEKPATAKDVKRSKHEPETNPGELGSSRLQRTLKLRAQLKLEVDGCFAMGLCAPIEDDLSPPTILPNEPAEQEPEKGDSSTPEKVSPKVIPGIPNPLPLKRHPSARRTVMKTIGYPATGWNPNENDDEAKDGKAYRFRRAKSLEDASLMYDVYRESHPLPFGHHGTYNEFKALRGDDPNDEPLNGEHPTYENAMMESFGMTVPLNKDSVALNHRPTTVPNLDHHRPDTTLASNKPGTRKLQSAQEAKTAQVPLIPQVVLPPLAKPPQSLGAPALPNISESSVKYLQQYMDRAKKAGREPPNIIIARSLPVGGGGNLLRQAAVPAAPLPKKDMFPMRGASETRAAAHSKDINSSNDWERYSDIVQKRSGEREKPKKANPKSSLKKSKSVKQPKPRQPTPDSLPKQQYHELPQYNTMYAQQQQMHQHHQQPFVPQTLMPARIRVQHVPVVVLRQAMVIEPTGEAPGSYGEQYSSNGGELGHPTYISHGFGGGTGEIYGMVNHSHAAMEEVVEDAPVEEVEVKKNVKILEKPRSRQGVRLMIAKGLIGRTRGGD